MKPLVSVEYAATLPTAIRTPKQTTR